MYQSAQRFSTGTPCESLIVSKLLLSHYKAPRICFTTSVDVIFFLAPRARWAEPAAGSRKSGSINQTPVVPRERCNPTENPWQTPPTSGKLIQYVHLFTAAICRLTPCCSPPLRGVSAAAVWAAASAGSSSVMSGGAGAMMGRSQSGFTCRKER